MTLWREKHDTRAFAAGASVAVLAALRAVTLPDGESIPALGTTWHMAEDPRRRTDEIAALRHGTDLRMSLIDTAEMYA
jgi:diketogulonate reductase-like aldo/keto reductase